MQNNVSPTHPKVSEEPENLGAASDDDTQGHIRLNQADQGQDSQGSRSLRVQEVKADGAEG